MREIADFAWFVLLGWLVVLLVWKWTNKLISGDDATTK